MAKRRVAHSINGRPGRSSKGKVRSNCLPPTPELTKLSPGALLISSGAIRDGLTDLSNQGRGDHGARVRQRAFAAPAILART